MNNQVFTEDEIQFIERQFAPHIVRRILRDASGNVSGEIECPGCGNPTIKKLANINRGGSKHCEVCIKKDAKQRHKNLMNAAKRKENY